MKRRKLKPFVVPFMYGVSIMMLVGSVYCIERIINNTVFISNEVDDVENINLDEYNNLEYDYEDIPVINADSMIIRPYLNGDVKIVKNYYDYQSESSAQENSIIYYGNTYMQNSGVDYGLDDVFDVVSILDGTVIEVIDDEIMGKTVKIKHSNDLISVYQSLGDVFVKVDDKIVQGVVIGTSGESNVSPELSRHLHFELYYKGSVVNPENYYDKYVGELK